MASNIYKMTLNKINYEISMGNDVEKYRTIVNNYYRVKQITLAERDSLLELIDNAYVVEEPKEPEEPEVTEELEGTEIVEEEESSSFVLKGGLYGETYTEICYS